MSHVQIRNNQVAILILLNSNLSPNFNKITNLNKKTEFIRKNRVYQARDLKRRKHVFLDEKAKFDRLERKIKKYDRYKSYREKTAEEDFRLKEKLAMLSIVASNFMMTGHSPTLVLTKREEGDEVMMPVGGGQKDRASELISKADFRKLYRGGKGRKTDPLMIITAICMYVMRQDNPQRGDIRYSNDFIRNVGVTKEVYQHISQKLDVYQNS
jgi:hypothetical protein